MRRLVSPVTAFAITGILATAAAAQTNPTPVPAQQPPPITNLQIFPKETPRAELIAAMQGFVQALGVQSSGGCGYCHAGTAPAFDFASDAKPAKGVARKMMVMSREIATRLPEITGKPAADVTRVRCATCHRGVAIPKLLPDVLTDTAAKSGIAGAVQQYRDLRAKYYGGQSYDFSETALVATALPLINGNKPDDAIAWLQLNAEFYPKSSPTYAALGQAYAKKTDTANAIKSFEKAIELDPNNQNAKRQLEQLKK
ncbi:MAG TPA: c-type cytochrome [Vicinamibacterales bacterium]|jgi:tetratricopeptide (TPR) repeat protein|nr:c-type cytochrome [Vicinamibacterales bacterium]